MATYFATNEFSRMVLNAYRGISVQGVSNLFVGLFQSDPTSSGTSGIEVAYPGYARQPISFSPPAPFNGHIAIRNDANISWPESSVTTADATHIGIFDGAVGGRMLLRGVLTQPLSIMPNRAPGVLAGDITYFGRGNFSLGFRAATLDILRGVTLPGFDPYVALHSADPDTGGFELGGEGYARAEATFSAPQIIDGIMTIVNESEISFPIPLASWGNFAAASIMRGEASSQVASYEVKPEAVAIHRNYVVQWGVGRFRIRHD